MVGAGLVDRFGLGALGEGRVGEPRGEAVAVLFGGRDGLRQARFLGVEVDRVAERQGDGDAVDDDLRRAGGHRIGCDRSAELGHARQRRRIGGKRSIVAASPPMTCGTSVALHGMLSSARSARTSVDDVDQPVDFASRRRDRAAASGAGHLATISS